MYFYTCNNRNKKTSEKIFICDYTVPSLFSFLFLLLAVPFFPLYRFMAHNFFHGYIFFQTDSGLNSGTDTLSELTSNTQNILLNQVNDFSVSISSQFSGGLNTILFSNMDNGCYDYVSPHPSFIKLCTFHKKICSPASKSAGKNYLLQLFKGT